MPLMRVGGPHWLAAADLAAPLALGARGLVVGPPRSGRTMLLQQIAHSVAAHAAHADLRVLLVDRPIDEHMEWKHEVPGARIHGTTSEASANEHASLATIFDDAAAHAAAGQDVVLLVDSLAALARALNASMDLDERILTGGMMATALRALRECFGKARAYEPDGSLTIIGTATADSNQELDTVVFEELVGTGNVEYRLSGDIAGAGIIPGIDIERSGSRGVERIVGDDDAERRARLRDLVSQYGSSAGLAMLLEHLEQHGQLPDV